MPPATPCAPGASVPAWRSVRFLAAVALSGFIGMAVMGAWLFWRPAEPVLWCDPAAVKEKALAAFLENPAALSRLRTDWTGCWTAGLAAAAAEEGAVIADARWILASGRPAADATERVAQAVIEAARRQKQESVK